jgi:protoheme IX farnesyltransferase
VSARIEPAEVPEVHAPPEPATPSRPTTASFAVDLIALTKPRITGLVIATTGCGLWLATRMQAIQGIPARPSSTLGLAVLGTVLIVCGANALNMYIERDTDGLMERTRDRPLPRGRLSADTALWFGVALSSSALAILFAAVNLTTGILAAFALISYVLVYTPLKRKTTLALPIGAVPGAIPPLLGWTAVTGRIDPPGLALFGILFLWQIPHFLAIATFRKNDYGQAGLKVLPIERGDRVTRHHILFYLTALVGVSLLLVPLGAAGSFYFAAACVLGAGFLAAGAYGLRPSAGVRWARWLFALSIVYLVFLLAALMVPA